VPPLPFSSTGPCLVSSKPCEASDMVSPFPLSSFFIIAEALSRMLKEARSIDLIRGVKVSDFEEVSHLQFVDNILQFVWFVEGPCRL
jgi:hypothetical protein